MSISQPCVVYRCSRQDEMYLYLRSGFAPESLPQALRARLGALTEVMQLTLSPERPLARADVSAVIERLRDVGYYLQLPPAAGINAHLYFGD
jgi:uncharacterized protein YcgL (UPF0745 family)